MKTKSITKGGQTKKECTIVVVLYFICVLIRFISGAFLKHIETLEDETFYLNMAESFANGLGFRVQNAVVTDSVRVLYSLIISPAFLATNRYIQAGLIQLINSLLISSAIIPYMLIVRRTVQSERIRVFAYFFFLLLPELCQSVTFASENLYLPLTTWFIYIFVISLDRESGNSIWSDLGLGAVLYLLKLCKDAAIILPAGVLLYYFYESLTAKGITAKAGKALRRLWDMALIIGIYGTITIAGNQLWFRKLGISDKAIDGKDIVIVFLTMAGIAMQLILGKCIKRETVQKSFCVGGMVVFSGGLLALIGMILFAFLHAEMVRVHIIPRIVLYIDRYFGRDIAAYTHHFLYNIMYILMAVGILPMILPALYGKDMNNEARKLYIINTCLALVGVLFMTSYMSDHTEPSPTRGILRYVCFLWLPYFIVFFSMYKRCKEKVNVIKWISFMIVLGVFILFFKGAKTGSSIDMDMLFYIVYHFTFVMWQLKFPLAVVAVVTVPLYHRNRALLYKGFWTCFALIMLLDNALMLKDHYTRYGMSQEEYSYIYEIESFIREHPDDTFIMCEQYREGVNRYGNCVGNTFYGGIPNVYSIYFAYFASDSEKKGERKLDDIVKITPFGAKAEELNRADYLLVQNTQPYHIYGDNAKMILGSETACFDLYELKDHGTIPNIDYYTE